MPAKIEEKKEFYQVDSGETVSSSSYNSKDSHDAPNEIYKNQYN